jgi:hypothetical protein
VTEKTKKAVKDITHCSLAGRGGGCCISLEKVMIKIGGLLRSDVGEGSDCQDAGSTLRDKMEQQHIAKLERDEWIMSLRYCDGKTERKLCFGSRARNIYKSRIGGYKSLLV